MQRNQGMSTGIQRAPGLCRGAQVLQALGLLGSSLQPLSATPSPNRARVWPGRFERDRNGQACARQRCARRPRGLGRTPSHAAGEAFTRHARNTSMDGHDGSAVGDLSLDTRTLSAEISTADNIDSKRQCRQQKIGTRKETRRRDACALCWQHMPHSACSWNMGRQTLCIPL